MKTMFPDYPFPDKIIPKEFFSLETARDILSYDKIEAILAPNTTGMIAWYEHPDDTQIVDVEMINDKSILYIESTSTPSYFKTAYDSYESLISEYEEKLSKYFPKNFDYKKRICSITGTWH